MDQDPGNKLAKPEQVDVAKGPEPKPPTKLFKGMRIDFFGTVYKVTAIRPNGKVTLKTIRKGQQA